MPAIGEWIGVATGILALIGAVVAVTRYVTQLQAKQAQLADQQVRLQAERADLEKQTRERLEDERKAAAKRFSDLEVLNTELRSQLTLAQQAGMAAMAMKARIDDELTDIMRMMGAGGGSIYIPILSRSSPAPLGLLFFSIQPISQETATLRKKVIPMESLAGRCFLTGNGFATTNSKKDAAHYDKADIVSGYQTQDALNVPLRSNTSLVGVLQLLNRNGPTPFADADVRIVESASKRIAERLTEVLSDPANLDTLGIAPEKEAQGASILFCDMTRSSLLFQTLNAAAAIQHLNEYLDVVCDVAMANGGAIDKYMGDGVLFRFNVPNLLTDHQYRAVKAAVEITDRFNTLRQQWKLMGDELGTLHTRIGVACGPLYLTPVGHHQYQHLTVIGPPVNVAVNLVDSADRDRNVIIVDQAIRHALGDRIDAEQLPPGKMGKAAAFTAAAFELKGLRG